MRAPKFEPQIELVFSFFAAVRKMGNTVFSEEVPITVKLDQSTYICEAALWLIWRTRGEMRLGRFGLLKYHPETAGLAVDPSSEAWRMTGSFGPIHSSGGK